MIRLFPLRFTMLAFLTAAAPAHPVAAEPPEIVARIGQTIRVDGPQVTPLAILEDSRCPRGTRCVWAGRLRIRARITTGAGARIGELTLGRPTPVADGQLTLVSAAPSPGDGKRMAARRYRLGFRFAGGL